MVRLRSGTFALLAVVTLLVSGCAKQEATTLRPTGDGQSAGDANVTFEAPTWSKGDYWDHQWDLYANGTVILSFLVRTIVAEAGPSSYMLTTDNSTMAAFHGAFGFPTLGSMQTAGGLWEAQSDGNSWPWYQFPLFQGESWDANVATKGGDGAVVHYNLTLDVKATNKDYATIEITAGGTQVATYDYDAAAKWFSDMTIYDDHGKPAFRIQRLATGHNFQGTVYDATGKLVASGASVVSPFGVQANPVIEFPIETSATHVLAFVFPFAFTGASTADLIAPDGRHYDAQAVDANGNTVVNQSLLVLAPAAPGTWRLATAGAGVVAGGGILAFSITERALQV